MNHKHSYNITQDSQSYLTANNERYFYYNCTCIKCGHSHTAGHPKKPFMDHLNESRFAIGDNNSTFFFLTDNMQIKLLKLDGTEYQNYQDCKISDDDFDVKSIIE